MFDFRGKAFEKGQRVVWPVRNGSSLYMEQGIVVEVLPKKLKVKGERYNGTEMIKTLTKFSNIVIVS